MLTADLKVNGKVIGHIEAKRLPWPPDDDGRHAYSARMALDRLDTRYRDQIGKSVTVWHDPDTEDAWALIHKVLDRTPSRPNYRTPPGEAGRWSRPDRLTTEELNH